MTQARKRVPGPDLALVRLIGFPFALFLIVIGSKATGEQRLSHQRDGGHTREGENSYPRLMIRPASPQVAV